MADPMKSFKVIDHFKNAFKFKLNLSDIDAFDLTSTLSDNESCIALNT